MDLFDIAVTKKLAGGGGGGGANVLEVGIDIMTGALNKTWREINEAFPLVYITGETSGTSIKMIATSLTKDAAGTCYVQAQTIEGQMMLIANNEDGYPVISQ